MAAQMRTSHAGLDLIKRFEGYRPRYEPLPDGRWIIGYGHVRSRKEGARVTDVEAEAILREYDLPKIERAVGRTVLAPLNQNEFDALVSLAFNIGKTAFTRSDVVAAINGGNRLQAAQAFDSWNYAEIGGRLQLVDLLVRRRAAEKALFLSAMGDLPAAASGVYQARQKGREAVPEMLPRQAVGEGTSARLSSGGSSGAYIVSRSQAESTSRTATEDAAEAVRQQMEKILRDDDTRGVPRQAVDTPQSDLAPEPASPEDITAAISALAGSEQTRVRKSVWPQHADLSPPPAFERQLVGPAAEPTPQAQSAEPLHLGRIDDLEEVKVDTEQLVAAIAAHTREDKAARQSSAVRAFLQGVLALMSFIIAIYGLGLQIGLVVPMVAQTGPYAPYLPGFLLVLGGSMTLIMGYYTYVSLGLRRDN